MVIVLVAAKHNVNLIRFKNGDQVGFYARIDAMMAGVVGRMMANDDFPKRAGLAQFLTKPMQHGVTCSGIVGFD